MGYFEVIIFYFLFQTDFFDHIPDLFYDPGQITNPSQFLTLDEYNEQSVNDRRPIFLINLQKWSESGS